MTRDERSTAQGDGAASAEESPALGTYTERSAAPRDLRTAEELARNGYTRLGEPRALLVREHEEAEPLYSTSEARLLKHDLWPRGRKLSVVREAPDAADTPFGAANKGSDPGATSAPRPGEAGSRPGRRRYGGAATVSTAFGRPDEWLANLFAEGFVVLDTETTGLGPRAEVIEVAALDSSGTVLLESRVWPRAGQVPQAATRIHGFSIDDLKGAPTWPELLLELERQLDGRRVLAWNAPFDERMLQQSSRLWSLAPRLPAFECAMRGYAHVRGIGRSTMRLERAAQVERVLTAAQEHRSLGDAKLVLAVLRRLQEARAVRA